MREGGSEGGREGQREMGKEGKKVRETEGGEATKGLTRGYNLVN